MGARQLLNNEDASLMKSANAREDATKVANEDVTMPLMVVGL